MLPGLDIVARILLLPLLLAQAIWVRRRAQFLPEPSGARSGATGTGPELRLLILGDSSAAGVGASTQDDALSGQVVQRLSSNYAVTWQLHAVTGATTKDRIALLETLPQQEFDIVITALGVNDVTRVTPARIWRKRQARMLDLLTQKFGAKHIFLTGLPPMGLFPLLPQPLAWVLGAQANRFDHILADLSAHIPAAHHVRVDYPLDPELSASDGYHPTPRAYALWADHMVDEIRRHWPV